MSGRKKLRRAPPLSKEEIDRLERKEIEKARILESIQRARDEVTAGKRLINLGAILHIICSVGFQRETVVACSTCKDLWNEEDHLAQIADKTYTVGNAYRVQSKNRVSFCIGERIIRGHDRRSYVSSDSANQDGYGDAARDTLVADRLQRLIAAGATENAIQSAHPLFFAIGQGLTESVRVLCSHPGLDIDIEYESRAPLVTAVAALQSSYTVSTSLDIVRILLDLPKIDVNACGSAATSALSLACEQSRRTTDTALIRMLLEVPGIDVNLGKVAPLCHAISASRRDVFELLTSFPGIDPNAPGSEERPLVLAISGRQMTMVNVLLSLPTIDVNMPSTTKISPFAQSPYAQSTPLIAACISVDLLTVRQLCARPEIDINKVVRGGRGKSDFTALMKTCEQFSSRPESLALLQFLLEQPGIDINQVCDPSQRSALSDAAGAKDKGAFVVLLKQPGISVGANVLSKHLRDPYYGGEGLADVVRSLLAVPDLFPVGGRARALADAVTLSCDCDLRDLLVLLLPLPDFVIRREDVVKVFKNGKHALATLLAEWDGFASFDFSFAHLVACVCEATRVSPDGREYESRFAPGVGHVEILKALMRHPKFILEDDFYRHVENACEKGHQHVVAAFVAHPDFDVNRVRYTDGATFVMIAADNKHTEVVRVLLAAPGIDLNMKSYEGKRALHYANMGAQSGSDLQTLLLSHGAYADDAPDGRSRSGRTLKAVHR